METIDIYEDITPGLEVRVRDSLPDEGPVTVRINSYGGAVDVGHTIRHLLADYPGHVTCVVDGVAASAASIIAIAGSDELVMREGSELMIHQASLGMDGNSSSLRSMAERLEKMDAELANVYAAKAGGDAEHWLGLMAAETWFSAADAVDAGLADRVDGRVAQAVSVDRIAAKYNYSGRRLPPDERKENGMSVKALAAELGVSESEFKATFARIMNETVETTVKVDVSYPQDTRIAPTETVTVYPVVGQPASEASSENPDAAENAVDVEPIPVAAEVIEGITFELGAEVEGFTTSIDAQSGALKITASTGVEVGAEAEFVVSVSGTDVPVKVTVRSLSEEQETTEEITGSEVDVVAVDKHTYNALVEGNRAYNKILEKQAVEQRHARVDQWINQGRIAASARDEAIKVIDRDENLAAEIYGSRPVNTIPRREMGNVGSGEPKSKVEALIAKANENRKNRK